MGIAFRMIKLISLSCLMAIAIQCGKSVSSSDVTPLSEKYRARSTLARIAPVTDCESIADEGLWKTAGGAVTVQDIAYANLARIRQSGPVTHIGICKGSGSFDNLDDFRVQIWHYTGDDTCGGGSDACFDIAGETENLAAQIRRAPQGRTIIALNNHVGEDYRGDFYGTYYSTSGAVGNLHPIQVVAANGGNAGYENTASAVVDAGEAWTTEIAMVGIPHIEIYTDSGPQVAIVSCSHGVGHDSDDPHRTYIYDNRESPVGAFMLDDHRNEPCFLIEQLTGLTCQNLSINGIEQYEMLWIIYNILTDLEPRILITPLGDDNTFAEATTRSTADDGLLYDDILYGANNSGLNGADSSRAGVDFTLIREGIFNAFSGVDENTEVVKLTADHDLETGETVRVRNGGAMPSGIDETTIYKVLTGNDCDGVRCGSDELQFSTNLTTAVDITASNTSRFSYIFNISKCTDTSPCMDTIAEWEEVAQWAKDNDVVLVRQSTDRHEKNTWIDHNLATDNAVLDEWTDAINRAVKAVYPETVFMDLEEDNAFFDLTRPPDSDTVKDYYWATDENIVWKEIRIPAAGSTACDFSDGSQPILQATSCTGTWGTATCSTHASTEPAWNCAPGSTTVDNSEITWTVIGYTDFVTEPRWRVNQDWLVHADDDHRTNDFYHYYAKRFYQVMTDMEGR